MAKRKANNNKSDVNDVSGTISPERQPPYSISDELSVLGAMLLSKEAIGQVIPIIKNSEYFFLPANRIIFEALLDLYMQNIPPDPQLLKNQLKKREALEQIGGAAYIAKILSAVPSAANVEYYAYNVRDKYILRKLINVCNETLSEAFSDAFDAKEVIENAEKRIFQITEDRISEGPEHLKDFLEETFRQLEEREGHYITGLATGFTELDDLTSGLQNGELIIIAARPSMGKTSLGVNIAEHISVEENKPVAFFSLEMSKQQVVQRLLCSRAKVDSHRLRRNMLSDEDIAKLHRACDVLRDAPLYIDDTPGMSILELRSKARLMKLREDISAVFVDYLQLLRNPGAESRQQEISQISQGLKALARELNIPVVALAQLNRGVEGRESKRPRMSDLRESGSIEQEADLIMLIHREDYYRDTGEQMSDDTFGKAEIIIAKQRNGPIGTVEVQFDRKHTRFNNLAHIADDMQAYIPTSDNNQVPF